MRRKRERSWTRKGDACQKLLPATVHQATVIPSTQETRKHPDAAKSWRPGTRRSEVCVFNNYRRSLSGWPYSSHTKGTQTARDQDGWTSATVGLVAATEFKGQGWAVRWDRSRVPDQSHGLWRHLHWRDRSNDTSSVFRAQVTRKMQTDWPFSRSGSCASRGTQDGFRQPCSPRQRQETDVKTSEGSALALLHGQKDEQRPRTGTLVQCSLVLRFSWTLCLSVLLMPLVCCQLHLSHLVNLAHGLHFCFLIFVLVIFIPPPPLIFLFFQSFSGSSCFLFVDPVFFSVFVFLWHFHRTRTLSAFAKQITVLLSFFQIVLCFWFRSVFSFLNLELFVTVRLFKSSLKKDRAILSETSGQRKLVCWCWGRAKRLILMLLTCKSTTWKLPSKAKRANRLRRPR